MSITPSDPSVLLFRAQCSKIFPFSSLSLYCSSPTSDYTEKAVAFAVALNAVIYAATVPALFAPNPAAAAGGDKPSFSTLKGVTALFRTAPPAGVTAAWLHYVAFDLLTGQYIVKDAMANGISKVATGVALFFTLMGGPTGLVVYGLARLAAKADTKFIPWIKLW